MNGFLHMPGPWWEILIRLVMAVLCGALIGWDREKAGRAAGLRTNMLIALGAATFALISAELLEGVTERYVDESNPLPPGDPFRIIGSIVGGVGFLGAGAIIQAGGKVRGLTTAAAMWTVAGIGAACGLGFYAIAVLVTALAFFTLAILGLIEPALRDAVDAPEQSEGS